MAFPASEPLREFRVVQPIQMNVSQTLTSQANRMLRLNTEARIAPDAGIGAATRNLIDAGVGRAVDVRA